MRVSPTWASINTLSGAQPSRCGFASRLSVRMRGMWKSALTMSGPPSTSPVKLLHCTWSCVRFTSCRRDRGSGPVSILSCKSKDRSPGQCSGMFVGMLPWKKFASTWKRSMLDQPHQGMSGSSIRTLQPRQGQRHFASPSSILKTYPGVHSFRAGCLRGGQMSEPPWPKAWKDRKLRRSASCRGIASFPRKLLPTTSNSMSSTKEPMHAGNSFKLAFIVNARTPVKAQSCSGAAALPPTKTSPKTVGAQSRQPPASPSPSPRSLGSELRLSTLRWRTLGKDLAKNDTRLLDTAFPTTSSKLMCKTRTPAQTEVPDEAMEAAASRRSVVCTARTSPNPGPTRRHTSDD
mmetsp:Transcript_29387/g.80316  ORF Transcript_29387/g.80316 Transcript_29387/m.80316 type:complete len:347 (+) Transcript_29387:263-1303(+)